MWSIRAALFGSVLLSCVAASTASAAVHPWPAINHGDTCAGLTLQGCIDAVSAGDVIQVRTNTPIHEDLTISKSLTLCASAGFTPTLSALHDVSLVNPNPSSNTIVFQEFTLTQGNISAVQGSSGTFNVTVRYLRVLNTDGLHELQIRTGQQGPYGPVQFEISSNHLTIPPNSQVFASPVISVEGGSAASMTGVIQGNDIDQFDGGHQGAIKLYNFNTNLDVDVIANEIRGSAYNEGITLHQSGPGSSDVRYLDNLVVGQTTESGQPGAYVIYATKGSTSFEIVNNTAADGDRGILISGRDDLGASWSGIVTNNIVSGMSQNGLSIDQPLLTSGVVENEHNLIFDVASNDFIAGPGTLFVDPLFVGGGNYRLSDPSPARNAGNDARVPADLTNDLDGQPRKVGHVDMGAYESSTTVAVEATLPMRFHLRPNIPNPFNPSTTIRYELPQPERVRLGVFDVQGRIVRWLVRDKMQPAGRQQSVWDGRDAHGVSRASGVYFYRLEAGSFTATRRMVLVR